MKKGDLVLCVFLYLLSVSFVSFVSYEIGKVQQQKINSEARLYLKSSLPTEMEISCFMGGAEAWSKKLDKFKSANFAISKELAENNYLNLS